VALGQKLFNAPGAPLPYMFLVKLFGIMDIYSAVVMLLVQYGVAPWRVVLTASAWLIIKGWLFRGELASMIDMGIGVYHLLMVILPIGFLTWVLAIYLLVKGAQSLF
jgi:hypothetical protein